MRKNTFCKKERSWKRANELLTMALNSEGAERISLARKALNVNHDFVDAYVFLGDEAANSQEREQWYRMAIAVGRRVLGDDFFNEHQGNLWQFPKARPFLNGLQGLADELLYQNREDEALFYYRNLLHLNKNDDQGIRYSLFKILVSRDCYAEARELIDEFIGDNSSRWLYNDALLTYLESGVGAEAQVKLEQAIQSNSLICELLLNPPTNINIDQLDLGLVYQEAESFDYVIDMGHLWSEESGILKWLNNFKPNHLKEKGMLLAGEGRTLLEEGNLLEAEEVLSLALKYRDDLSIRNDLGYCKLLLEKYQESLNILRPVLGQQILNPFGNGLAAEAAYRMGDELNTWRFLKQAINQFERELRDPFFDKDFPSNWYHLPIMLKDLAGLLGNHRLVIALYKRWKQYCVLEEDLFQVGVAYFNLKNYKKAIHYWEKINHKEAWFLLKDYIAAAKAFNTEGLPPLQLEYLTPFHLLATYQVSQNSIYEMVQKLGAIKLLVIAKLFEQSGVGEDEKRHYVQVLSSLGEWGTYFANTLLNSHWVPYPWKVAAIFSLVSKGDYSYGDLVPIVIDGQSTDIQIDEDFFSEFSFTDQPDAQHLNHILSLFREEKYHEIIELVESDTHFYEEHYLIMHILAVSCFYIGDVEKTCDIANWFFSEVIQNSDNIKDDLLVLNAGLWSLLGDAERSLFCLGRLSEVNLDNDLLNLYELLIEQRLE